MPAVVLIAVVFCALLVPRAANDVARPIVFDSFLEVETLLPWLIPGVETIAAGEASKADHLAPASFLGSEALTTIRNSWLFLISALRPFDEYDWIAHVLLLFGLTIAVLGFARRMALLPATAFLAGLAVSGEALQAFVPGRTASLADMGYNLLGVGAGLLVFVALDRMRSQASSRQSG